MFLIISTHLTVSIEFLKMQIDYSLTIIQFGLLSLFDSLPTVYGLFDAKIWSPSNSSLHFFY